MKHTEEFVGNKQIQLDINMQLDEIYPVMHALSSKLRLQIVRMIGMRSMNLNEMAQVLDVPLSTISLNVSVLEKAGLIYAETQNGVRGTMKLCSRMTDRIMVNLVASEGRPSEVGELTMPIGCYAETEGIKPTCGLAGTEGIIGLEDQPLSFYLPERIHAQLIWLRQGHLLYRFPTMPIRGVALEWIELSVEMCSEALNYRNEWESDIGLQINGHDVGSWLCPGDFGGRRGMLNPPWWSDISTQFGHLKTWRVDESGSYLDQVLVSPVTLSDLQIQEGEYFTVRIGVDAHAPHLGGMNLFGAGFGDFPQHIVLKYASH